MGVRHIAIRPRSLKSAISRGMVDFTGISCPLCLSMLASVRYNPHQVLGHMLGQRGQGMVRKINRLNARLVATVTEFGRHADGSRALSLDFAKRRPTVGVPVPLAWQANRNRLRFGT